MASQVNRLAEQLKLAVEGTAWHGPSVLELLQRVLALEAASHPIAGAHSIWELLLHIRSDHDLFSGVAQHDLYHAGQIALLKQALATSER
ncbi:MAG: hypothetical protein EG823_07220 [Actinobacteria bacterium]|nr:hypothetical protein [Actinomycetota bacterium]